MVYKCKILRRYRADDPKIVYEDTLFKCETDAVSFEEATNNCWYRAAVDKKVINPKRKYRQIELRTKIDHFKRHQMEFA